jgi:hypothetical protein
MPAIPHMGIFIVFYPQINNAEGVFLFLSTDEEDTED